MRKTRTTTVSGALYATPAPTTAPVGGSGEEAGETGSEEAPTDPITTAAGTAAPVIEPSSGLDATVAPASASPAASVAATLEAALPSAPAVAASLTAPVLTEAGAVLAGNVTTTLEGAAIPASDTDDLRSGEAEGLQAIGHTIMVRSVSDRGRRRAGISFGPVPQPVEVDMLTGEEIEGLLNDPQLVVQFDD